MRLLAIALLSVSCTSIFGQSLRVRLDTTNSVGQSISTIGVGEPFFLGAWVSDGRKRPLGVFSSYIDIEYTNSSSIEVGDQWEYGGFSLGVRGSSLSPGLVDEVGGIASISESPGLGVQTEELLVRIPFEAQTPGEVVFTSDLADILPRNASTLVGLDEALADTDVAFGSTVITIVPEPAAYLWFWGLLPILGARRRRSI